MSRIKLTFIDRDLLKKTIVDKLNTGHAVLYGHLDSFGYIEDTLYTPGTDANEEFELIFSFHPIAFCKKSKRFKQMFKEDSSKPVFVIHGSYCGTVGFLFNIREAKPGADIPDIILDTTSATMNYLESGKFEWRN